MDVNCETCVFAIFMMWLDLPLFLTIVQVFIDTKVNKQIWASFIPARHDKMTIMDRLIARISHIQPIFIA